MQTNGIDELFTRLTDAFDPELGPVEASNLFDGFKVLVGTLKNSSQMTATQRSMLGTIHQALQGKDLVELTTDGRMGLLEAVLLMRVPRPSHPNFRSVAEAFKHASEHGHATLVDVDGKVTARITVFKDQLPVISFDDDDVVPVLEAWEPKPITHLWTIGCVGSVRGFENVELLVTDGWTVGPWVLGMGCPASRPVQEDYMEEHDYVVCQECGSHIMLEGRESWLDPQFDGCDTSRLFNFTCDWDACGKEFDALVQPPRRMIPGRSDLG
jgi:DNA-directed RNA polymerase subunit RPC12/RpoP